MNLIQLTLILLLDFPFSIEGNEIYKSLWIQRNLQDIQQCLTNQFLNNDVCESQYCQYTIDCHYSCLECTSSSSSSCLSCLNDGNRLLENSICKCKEKYYDENNEFFCQRCRFPCLECQGKGEDACLSCQNQMILQGNKCKCGEHQFFNYEKFLCEDCHPSCSECFGSLDSNCVKCKEDNKAILQSNICICKDGYYRSNIDYYCHLCHSNCKTCSGPGSNECLSCDNNKKIGSQCNCMIGYYTQLISNQKYCWKCHQSCASCQGQGEFNCLTCNSNATLQASSQMCICNSGYVWNGDICIQCDGVCSGMCRYNSSNCCIAPCVYCLNTQCSDCDASQACTICPQGKSGINCNISCHANCKSCNISSPTTCTSCDSPKILNGGTCDCPSGYVLSGTSCVNASCSSTCTSTGCVDGYYGANCAFTCHQSCRRCWGGADNQCNLCQNNAHVGSNNKCQCNFGYYMDATFNCFKCHYSCRECSTSDTYCTNCDYSYRTLNSSNQCICNSGYYDYGFQVCQLNCGVFCGNCIQPSPSVYQCLACALTNTYRNNDLPNNCPCQDGYFDNGTQICQQCNYKCQKCDNATSCILCQTNRDFTNSCNCDSGFVEQTQVCVAITTTPTNILGINYDAVIMKEYLSENCNLTNFANQVTCQCLDGYFMKNSKCLPCHINCKTCSVYSTNCLECSLNMINPPTCTCAKGYQLIDEVCIFCEQQCLLCSNNVCSTCISPLILDNDNTCQCSTGYYFDPISKSCNNCQIQCKKCRYQPDYCTQCNFNRILPYKCICPEGTYELSLSQPCQNCSKRCFTCQIDSTNCTTCATLRINPPSCQCKDGYFEDSQLNCFKCHKKCKTCQISANNCIECSIYRSNSQCQCNDGYYENNNQVCILCHNKCKTCYGSDEYNCLTCDNTRHFIQLNSTCICQKGYYSEQNECNPCIFDIISCQTNYCGDGIKQPQEKCDDWNNINRDGCNSNCQIEDGYTCTLIQNLKLSTLIFYSQCTQCSDINCKSCVDLKICSKCKEGYFLDDNQCHPCDHRCKECVGSSKTQCTTCLFDIFSTQNCQLCEDTPGLYLQEGKCISICGDGIIRQTEQCDDGNNIDGDGCSSICKNEQSWVCLSNNHTQSKCYIVDLPQASIIFQKPSNIYQSSRQGVIQFNKIMNIDLFKAQQLWVQQIKNINLLNYFIQYKQISIVDNSYSQINFSINFYETSQNMIYQINFTEYLPFDQDGQQQTSKFLEYSIEDYYKVSELQITTATTSKKVSYCFLAALSGAAFLGLFLQSLEFYWNTLDMLQLISYLTYINVKFPFLHLEFLSIFHFAQFDFLNQFIPSIFTQLGENEVQHNYPLLIERDVQENLLINLSSVIVTYALPFAIFLGAKLITKINYQVLFNKILILDSKNLGPCQIKFYIYQVIYYANKAANIYEHSFLFQILLRIYISSLFDLNFGVFTTVYCWTQHKQTTLNDNLQYLLANFLILIQIMIIIVLCNSMMVKRYQFESLQYKSKYGSLFEGFQIASIHNRQVAFLQLFKKILFMASLLVFFNDPLYQIGLLTSLYMVSAITSVFLQPNINNLEISKAIIQDLGILISLNFITIYYVQDNFKYFSQSTIEFISYFHIGIYILMLISQIIIDCYQQIKLVLEKYPNIKKCSTKKDMTNITADNQNYYVNQQFIIIQPIQRPSKFIP